MASAGFKMEDFEGTWTRVKPEAGSGEYEQQMRYMLAHGHDEERAAKLITGGYVQSWAPGEEEGAWDTVTTKDDGSQRVLTYPLGEWEETYEGKSDIFGETAEKKVVVRNTQVVSTPKGEAHVTESGTALGWETTARRLDPDDSTVMFVERVFIPKLADGSAGESVQCVQRFRKTS